MIKKYIQYDMASNGCGGSSDGSSKEIIPKELHACMGLNACKGNDRFGTNECAGSGYCATQTHSCHTMNNCSGQGGCGLFGSSEEQCRPGANDCKWQGSCGTPIPAERFSTQGPNRGKSVWLLARKLFEQRMEKARRDVNASPFPAGPPVAWLKENGGGYSCGWSGNKGCSFGLNSEEQNTQEMIDRSIREMDQTLKDCGCD